VPYHKVGGHCYNSKHRHLVDFVDRFALPQADFHTLDRVARIDFCGAMVGYPIELSLRDVARTDPDLAARALVELLAASHGPAPTLDRWFAHHFGPTLAEAYFRPYNDKIWARPCTELSPSWVAGKLPFPDKLAIARSLFDGATDEMPHRRFYYPRVGTPQALHDGMASGVQVRYGVRVERLQRDGGRWRFDGGPERHDRVISTVPLPLLPGLLPGGEAVASSAARLVWNRVSTMSWEAAAIVPATWTYVPRAGSITHRHIHIGSFLRPARPYTITEAIGAVPAEAIISDARQFPYLVRPVAHHESEHAYVVFDHACHAAREAVLGFARSLGVASIGRFGEWDYHNMDGCIASAIAAVDAIVPAV